MLEPGLPKAHCSPPLPLIDHDIDLRMSEKKIINPPSGIYLHRLHQYEWNFNEHQVRQFHPCTLQAQVFVTRQKTRYNPSVALDSKQREKKNLSENHFNASWLLHHSLWFDDGHFSLFYPFGGMQSKNERSLQPQICNANGNQYTYKNEQKKKQRKVN